ncbi:helix-turn-helix domain-containing protein [Tissierella carlieri]|uniref:helix-turn-helix domain-containing protein n=1 Tax=Tissierella carlieri TaxID=689904 RepID=UPI00386C251C
MIGKRIKTLRNERNLLQKDLAEQLNLSQQTISLYESEKRQPDYQILQSIADFFNVSVDYLLGRTDIKDSSILSVKEDETKFDIHNEIADEIEKLSPESQEELKKLIELYKIRDMQKRNIELSDELTTLD